MNQMNEFGTTELHVAAYNCDLELLNSRIALGDDVNLLDSQGFAPLHWSAFRGAVGESQPELAKILISHGADPNAVNGSGISVLEWAVRSRNRFLVETLLENGANPDLVSDGVTPLMVAAREGDRDIVKILISNGADISLEIDNFTAAKYAERTGH